MVRPLSQLLFSRVQSGSGSPRLVTLHPQGGFGPDVAEYGTAANPDGLVLALQSYKGVYIGREIVGYTWFVGPLDRPSPIFFGDGLLEIERFLWDEIRRQDVEQPGLPFLLGVEQGAILALASAAAFPDLLSGVIAIDGFFPKVPGWEPPLAPLDGLPILLIERPNTPTTSSGDVLVGEDLVTTLHAWGGSVTRLAEVPQEIPGEQMHQWMAQHPPRLHSPNAEAIELTVPLPAQ